MGKLDATLDGAILDFLADIAGIKPKDDTCCVAAIKTHRAQRTVAGHVESKFIARAQAAQCRCVVLGIQCALQVAGCKALLLKHVRK